MITSVPQYFHRVETLIWNKNDENATVDIRGPRWIPSGGNWTRVLFSAKVRFSSGEILEITDNFSRTSSSSDAWTRKFAYFFGEPSGDEMKRVFLFDNHGLYGEGGHFHLDDDERLLEGDPQLNGFSPTNVDIVDICEFIDMHFDGNPFPWVAA